MNAGLLEREGRVIAIHADRMTVRFERPSACGGCRAGKVCGGSAPTGELDLALPEGARLAPGDTVAVGIDETAALRATALAYLTPLIGFGAAMGAAFLAGLPEGGIAAASFTGLVAGFALMRILARRGSHRLEPAVIDAPGLAHPLARIDSLPETGDRLP